MRLLLIFLLLSVITNATAQKKVKTKGGEFVLSGKLIGRDSGALILWYPDTARNYSNYIYNNNIYDTAYLKQGNFVFKGRISEPSLCHLLDLDAVWSKGMHTTFFLEVGKQSIVLEDYKFPYMEIKGSRTQEEYKPLAKKLNELDQRLDSFSTIFLMATRSRINSRDSMERLTWNKKEQQSAQQMDSIREEMIKERIAFIPQHPSSYVSAFQLVYCLPIIPLDSSMKLYNQLTAEIRNSRVGRYCAKELEKIKQLSAGAIFPNFQAVDLNGKHISFEQFRGKFVLLFFWTSWSDASVKSLRQIKQLYNNYHAKGFEVITISRERSEESLKRNIRKEGVAHWSHFIPSGETATLFSPVNDAPKFILVDPSGNIIWSPFDVNSMNWQDALQRKIDKNKYYNLANTGFTKYRL